MGGITHQWSWQLSPVLPHAPKWWKWQISLSPKTEQCTQGPQQFGRLGHWLSMDLWLSLEEGVLWFWILYFHEALCESPWKRCCINKTYTFTIYKNRNIASFSVSEHEIEIQTSTSEQLLVFHQYIYVALFTIIRNRGNRWETSHLIYQPVMFSQARSQTHGRCANDTHRPRTVFTALMNRTSTTCTQIHVTVRFETRNKLLSLNASFYILLLREFGVFSTQLQIWWGKYSWSVKTCGGLLTAMRAVQWCSKALEKICCPRYRLEIKRCPD